MNLIVAIDTKGNIRAHAARESDPTKTVCGVKPHLTQPQSDCERLACANCERLLAHLADHRRLADLCEECGHPDPECVCACVNCGHACGEHESGDTGCPDQMFPGDLEKHLSWLLENNLEYHLDDDPSEIWDVGAGPKYDRVITMHRKMWAHHSQDEIWNAFYAITEEALPAAEPFTSLGTVGSEVMFHAGASKVIGNYELELYLKCGRVTSAGPDYLEVRLNEHNPDLDEWKNSLIWTVEDCLVGERLDKWDDLSDAQKCSFFEGYLAALVTE